MSELLPFERKHLAPVYDIFTGERISRHHMRQDEIADRLAEITLQLVDLPYPERNELEDERSHLLAEWRDLDNNNEPKKGA